MLSTAEHALVWERVPEEGYFNHRKSKIGLFILMI